MTAITRFSPEFCINAPFPSADITPGATAEAPDRPLRIALLGYRSAPFSGGQGVYLRYLSQALQALGHHVTVVSGRPIPIWLRVWNWLSYPVWTCIRGISGRSAAKSSGTAWAEKNG